MSITKSSSYHQFYNANSRSRSRSKSRNQHNSNRNNVYNKNNSVKPSKNSKYIKLINHEKNNAYKDPRIPALERFFLKKNECQEYCKLNLVLDLDETLVSTLCKPEEMAMAKNAMSSQNKNIKYISLKIQLGYDEPCPLLVFFRPKIFSFLDQISKLYNIYVYSHGMSNYVHEIINNIDPDRKYFNRNNIIANPLKTQVTERERKCLSKLSLNQKENIKKTLIIDDILNVWLESYSKNVIISKKFWPFYDISENKGKNIGYTIVFDEEIKQYLSFSSLNSEYFIDRNLQDNGEICQLENLSKKLIEISHIYNKYYFFSNDQDLLNVTEILSQKIKEIMNGLVFSVNEYECFGKQHLNAQHIAKKLIERMGGKYKSQSELFKNQNIQYLIIDRENLCSEKNRIHLEQLWNLVQNEIEEQKRNIFLIDNKWITDCYFNISWLEPLKYRFIK